MPTALYYAYIAGEYLPGQWKRIANIVRHRDRFTCRDCGERGWHVHHDHYRFLFHEEDDLTCLVTLCDRCHAYVHGRRGTNPRRCPTDEELRRLLAGL
jgi:5-methylcytosine-specific restriction endonuclease McrA